MSRACVTVARLSLAALIAVGMPLRPTADGPQLAVAYAKEAQTKRAPERPREFAPRISDLANIVNIVIGTVLRELPGGAGERDRPRAPERVVVAPLPDPDVPAADVRQRERRTAPEQVAFVPLPRPDGLGKVIEEASVLAAMVPPAPLHAEARPRAFVRSLAPVSIPAPSHLRVGPRAAPAAPAAPGIAGFRTLPPIPFAEGQGVGREGGNGTVTSLASAGAPDALEPPADLASARATLAAPTGTTAAGAPAAGLAEAPTGGLAASATTAAAGSTGSGSPVSEASAVPPPAVPATSARTDLPALLTALAARLSGPGGAGQHRDLASMLVYGLAAILAASLALRVARRPVSAVRRKAAAERGRLAWRAAGNAIGGAARGVSRCLALAASGMSGLAVRAAAGMVRLSRRATLAVVRVAGGAAAGVVNLTAVAGRHLSAIAASLAAIVAVGIRLAISLLWRGALLATGAARTRVIPAVRRTIAAVASVFGDQIIPAALSGIAAMRQAAATRLIPVARDGLGRGLDRAAGAVSVVWPRRGADRSRPARPSALRAAAARKALLSEEDAVRAVRMAFDRLETQGGAKRAS